MLIDAGPRDQRSVQGVADYGLIYCGEPLPEDLTIIGEVRVSLAVESDCLDTDFVAKLIDRHPDGRAMLLMDGVIRAIHRDPSDEPRHLAPNCVERLTIKGQLLPVAPASQTERDAQRSIWLELDCVGRCLAQIREKAIDFVTRA